MEPFPKRKVPFQRVDASKVQFEHEILKDNTFKGAKGSYGEKAHQDLIVTRGKGFTKEKNKVSEELHLVSFVFVSYSSGRACAHLLLGQVKCLLFNAFSTQAKVVRKLKADIISEKARLIPGRSYRLLHKLF